MEENKPIREFAFDKHNYMLLLIGVVIIIVGFFVMSGGGSQDPNVFKGDYSLSDDSFEILTNEFDVDDAITQQLEPIRNKIYPGEEELKTAMTEILGEESLQKNYYPLRSATHIDADIFNARRVTVAPLIVLFGYGFIIYAILKKKKSPTLLHE